MPVVLFLSPADEAVLITTKPTVLCYGKTHSSPALMSCVFQSELHCGAQSFFGLSCTSNRIACGIPTIYCMIRQWGVQGLSAPAPGTQ